MSVAEKIHSFFRLTSQHYPIHFGRQRLFGSLPAYHFNRIPDGRVVQLRDGRRYRVSGKPYYWGVYFFGEQEPLETRLLSSLIRPRDVCFDVGANYGWYSVLFGVLVGNEGFVHAFEPLADNFKELQTNVSENGLEQRICLNSLALSGGHELGQIYYNPDRMTAASLKKRSNDLHSQTVQITTLDSYCEIHGIEEINLIKCDVEGEEFGVFLGGEKILSKSQRPVLLFENSPSRSDPQKNTVNLLKSFGYAHFFSCLRSLRNSFHRLSTFRYPCRLELMRKRGYIEPYQKLHSNDSMVRSILAFDESRKDIVSMLS